MMEDIKITDTPLSEKWRLTSSKLQPLDLANLQKSLSAIAGQFSGDRLRSFRWGSETYADNQGNIVYDVNEVVDMPSPVSEEHVDVMVGKVVHESGHMKVNSSRTFSHHLRSSGEGTPLSYRMLNALGEEVYTDNYVSRTMGLVAAEYLRRARASSITLGEAEPEGVHNMLLAKHVYHIVIKPEQITELPELERLIYYIVDGFLPKLQQNLDTFERSSLYNGVWAAIEKLISAKVAQQEIAENMANDAFGFPQEGGAKSKKEQTKDNVEKAKKLLGLNDSEDAQGSIASGMITGERPSNVDMNKVREELDSLHLLKGRARNNVKNVEKRAELREQLKDLAEENLRQQGTPDARRAQEVLLSIQEAVENDSEDLSSIMEQYQADELGRAESMSVVYTRTPASAEEYDKFDMNLYKKLMWLRDLKNTLGKETLRGELSGQIDRHSLYRVGIDRKVFKQNRLKPRKDKKIVCLLDASSSMAGNTEIYQAAHALVRVVGSTEVLSYTSPGANQCVVTRQTSGHGFKRIKTNGGTPSGQALLATAMKFPDRMIVHFTDGDSNNGFTTAQAFEIIHKKFPRVHVVDVQMRPMRYNRSTEGLPPNVTRINIHEVSEFPKVLEDALKPWVRGGS